MNEKKSGYEDSVTLLECNIDDMSGELFGGVMEKLFSGGALDVWFTPVYGKKNRPLYQLSVLANHDKTEDMIRILFLHTTTAGIRRQKADRVIMRRNNINAMVFGMTVSVKKLVYEDIVKYTPEWTDCVKVSEAAKVPISEVYSRAQIISRETDGEQ